MIYLTVIKTWALSKLIIFTDEHPREEGKLFEHLSYPSSSIRHGSQIGGRERDCLVTKIEGRKSNDTIILSFLQNSPFCDAIIAFTVQVQCLLCNKFCYNLCIWQQHASLHCKEYYTINLVCYDVCTVYTVLYTEVTEI
jgi:hypothetical protein